MEPPRWLHRLRCCPHTSTKTPVNLKPEQTDTASYGGSNRFTGFTWPSEQPRAPGRGATPTHLFAVQTPSTQQGKTANKCKRVRQSAAAPGNAEAMVTTITEMMTMTAKTRTTTMVTTTTTRTTAARGHREYPNPADIQVGPRVLVRACRDSNHCGAVPGALTY